MEKYELYEEYENGTTKTTMYENLQDALGWAKILLVKPQTYQVEVRQLGRKYKVFLSYHKYGEVHQLN